MYDNVTRVSHYQYHWNNPMLVDGHTDSSGFELYMTPNLRPNNAGILMVGQLSIEVTSPKRSVFHLYVNVQSESERSKSNKRFSIVCMKYQP